MERISWVPFASISSASRRRRLAVASAVAVLAAAAPGASAQRKEMRLLVSNGVKAALVAVQAACEQQTGASLVADYGTSNSLRALAAKGQAFDFALMTEDAIDGLVADRKLDAASKTMVAKTRIGVGMRQSAGTVDVSTADAVRKALLGASSITYASDGASRPYIEKMLERLGIAAQLASRTHPEQGSPRATARVVAGQSDIVLTLISEIVPVPGLKMVGALPAEFQGEVSFAAGISAATAQAPAARQVIACLVGPSTGSSYASVGLDRAAR